MKFASCSISALSPFGFGSSVEPFWLLEFSNVCHFIESLSLSVCWQWQGFRYAAAEPCNFLISCRQMWRSRESIRTVKIYSLQNFASACNIGKEIICWFRARCELIGQMTDFVGVIIQLADSSYVDRVFLARSSWGEGSLMWHFDVSRNPPDNQRNRGNVKEMQATGSVWVRIFHVFDDHLVNITKFCWKFRTTNDEWTCHKMPFP